MNLIVFINESIYHHHFKAFLKTKKMRLTQRIFFFLLEKAYFALRAGNFSRIRAALPDNSRK